MRPNGKFLIFLGLIFIVTVYYSFNNLSIISKTQSKTAITAWTNTPEFTLLTRTHAGGLWDYYNIFLVSYHLFWPTKYWSNSDITIVFDDESEEDHKVATVLGNIPPYPKIRFEKKPVTKTFCSGWRNEGYSRQQYSNFYSELYTDKEYIGIIDGDVIFVTPITPEDLFIKGKPRVNGYNGCCAYGFEKSLPEVIGGEVIGEFMLNSVFPVVIKREHFKDMRDHITKRLGAGSFEEAFNKICSKYRMYSQFDIMVHYLWNFKRAEYSWHLKDGDKVNFMKLPKRMSNDKKVLEKDDPIVDIAVMIDHGKMAFSHLAPILCEVSKNEAGSCKKYKDSVEKWKLKDMASEKMFKEENGLKPEQWQKPWSSKKRSWDDAKKVHEDNVIRRYTKWPSFIDFKTGA